jgi:hypothetical protein
MRCPPDVEEDKYPARVVTSTTAIALVLRAWCCRTPRLRINPDCFSRNPRRPPAGAIRSLRSCPTRSCMAGRPELMSGLRWMTSTVHRPLTAQHSQRVGFDDPQIAPSASDGGALGTEERRRRAQYHSRSTAQPRRTRSCWPAVKGLFDRAIEEVADNAWRKIESPGLYATRVPGRLHSLHTTARREGWPVVQARRLSRARAPRNHGRAQSTVAR